jgi:hypothetical protein
MGFKAGITEEAGRASAPHASGLVRAISAALAEKGVPRGSIVDVASGPVDGLGFTVDDGGGDED